MGIIIHNHFIMNSSFCQDVSWKQRCTLVDNNPENSDIKCHELVIYQNLERGDIDYEMSCMPANNKHL